MIPTELFELKNPTPPTYLDGIVPEFRAAYLSVPSDGQYPWQRWLEPGISFIEYRYGSEYAEWDPVHDGDIPPRAGITRGSFGFPFKCMYFDYLYVAGGPGGEHVTKFFDRCRERAGLRIGYPITGVKSPFADRSLPLAPLWNGLLGNTLVYGGLLAFIIVLPRLIRHHIRRNRNCCTLCGYLLDDLTKCPECGTLRN